MARDVDHRPDLRLGVVLGAVLVAGPGLLVGWALSVRDRLPDPVARHWGGGGQADGYSSLQTSLWVTVGMVLVLAVPMGLAAVLGRQPRALRRCLAGTAAWVTVFVCVLVADSLRTQVDLADPTAAPAPGAGILVAVAAATLVAVVVGGVVRRDGRHARASGPPPPGAARRPAHAATTWRSRPAGIDRSAAVVGAIGTGVTVVVAALATWWLLPLALLVGAVCAGVGRFETRVDADGLTVAVLGRTVVAVPVEEVAAADVVDVDPFWEFGGWGLRVDVAGRTGVVSRRGPALRVRRGDGSEVLVTVDGADEAAATLNTLADRHHAR